MMTDNQLTHHTDSERSLRKARVNMNDLVKDRDVATSEVSKLRQEIDTKQQEIDSTRNSVVEERRQSAMKLDQERAQRDRARAHLEQRVEDMQKRSKWLVMTTLNIFNPFK